MDSTLRRQRFEELHTYKCALLCILKEKAEIKIINKIKSLKKKEAVIFLKKWQEMLLTSENLRGSIRLWELESMEYFLEFLKKEFRFLGIRMPKRPV